MLRQQMGPQSTDGDLAVAQAEPLAPAPSRGAPPSLWPAFVIATLHRPGYFFARGICLSAINTIHQQPSESWEDGQTMGHAVRAAVQMKLMHHLFCKINSSTVESCVKLTEMLPSGCSRLGLALSPRVHAVACRS